MRHLPAFEGRVGALDYALLAPALVLSQHLLVFLAYRSYGATLEAGLLFWLSPLRSLAFLPNVALPNLSAPAAAAAFAYSLLIAWLLALLSFRRASASGESFALAALVILPAFQIPIVLLLSVLPTRSAGPAEPSSADASTTGASDVAGILQGVIAGVTIVVAAVLVSALTFGAYGWGLFVATPFLVGISTAYLANRRAELTARKTRRLVLLAGLLGTLALLMLALEGLMCILLVGPLAALVAVAGGAIGRAAALARNARDKPLLSLAWLPAIFALEAAMPPAVPIAVHHSIEIAAPPASVWNALISNAPIASSPGLVGQAGLAFPIRSRLTGEGVGAERIGLFSTGSAHERVTNWAPGKTLVFKLLGQPPAMEEMSPWRRVHAPHVEGYFETDETRFELAPLPCGGTRLTIRAGHILRIDPALYWEPIARWAIGRNVARVLDDLRSKAEGDNNGKPRLTC